MLSIRDGEAIERALRSNIDHRTKALLRLRRMQLAKDQPEEDIAELAHFAIVQPGDTPAHLENAIGFSIFQNPADGSRLGDPDFTPGWEWMQDHGFAYELCFIMDDSGFGHVVIIPKMKRIAGDFLDFCRQHASEHASSLMVRPRTLPR
jgi:hypothetical protein